MKKAKKAPARKVAAKKSKHRAVKPKARKAVSVSPFRTELGNLTLIANRLEHLVIRAETAARIVDTSEELPLTKRAREIAAQQKDLRRDDPTTLLKMLGDVEYTPEQLAEIDKDLVQAEVVNGELIITHEPDREIDGIHTIGADGFKRKSDSQ